MLIPCSRIFIILGTACNLSCRYCIQHDIKNTEQSAVISPELIPWLEKEAEVSKNLHITFYGGEPLLYFKAIQSIVNHVHGDVTFGIITNGSLITDKIADFFNSHHFSVTVSWDGYGSKYTRLYDAMENMDNILKINDLCLSGVFSSKNYPLDLLDAFNDFNVEYWKTHKRFSQSNIDILFGDSDLYDVDLEKLKEQMGEIISITDSWLHKGTTGNPTAALWGFGFFMKYIRSMNQSRKSYYCQNGYNILNVDLAGNLYICHNTRDIVGNIRGNEISYLNGVMARHPFEKETADKCEKCHVKSLCGQRCLITDKWCDLRKAFLTPLVDYIGGYKHENASLERGSGFNLSALQDGD